MRAAIMLAFAGVLAHGQTAAKLEFEVASIKPSVIPLGGRGMTVGSRGGPAPTLLFAVQEQLGLRLEAKKLPIDIVMVDHIEKTPTEN
ncbi:MAG: TIGR03435 family protein [Bryobacteraceae bacterium]|jgi:Protein of unknown function (DUF3738)